MLTNQWSRVIFFTDEHRAEHDPRAASLSLQIAEDFEPNIGIVGSDGCNFGALSRHPTAIKYLGTTHTDVASFQEGVREKQDVCEGLYYIAGNHDGWFETYRWNVAELADNPKMSLENWLELDQLGVGYDTFEDNQGLSRVKQYLKLTPNMTIMHGVYVRKYSGYSAKAQLTEGLRSSTSVMMGHAHRGGVFITAGPDGEPIAGYECFHHQKSSATYLNSPNPDWHWGVALLETQVHPPYQFAVELINYIPTDERTMRARWRGKEYQSK